MRFKDKRLLGINTKVDPRENRAKVMAELRELRRKQRERQYTIEHWNDQEEHCYWCGLLFMPFGAYKKTKEHIVPKTLGGGDSPDNIKSAHAFCNNRRGHSTNWVPFHEHLDIGQRYQLKNGKKVKVK